MLTAKNAKNWFSDLENADHIAEWVDEKNKRSSLKIGDIILSTRGTVGLCAIVVDEVLPANIDQDLARISWAKRDKFLPEFVLAYLNSFFGQDHIIRNVSGMVQQGLPLNRVREIAVPLLSISMQSLVSKTVNRALKLQRDSVSSIILAEKILIKALGLDGWQPPEPLTYVRRASAVISTRRIDAEYFDPGAMAILEIIADKDAYELCKIAKVGTGFPWSSEYFIEDQLESGEPFVRIRNCKPGTLDIEDLDKLDSNYAKSKGQSKANPGDLVIGMDGLKWFYASLLTGQCYLNQRVAHIERLSNSQVSSEFLLAFLNSIFGQRQLLRAMTIAHTVGHITLEDVRSILIPHVKEEDHDAIIVLNLTKYT